MPWRSTSSKARTRLLRPIAAQMASYIAQADKMPSNAQPSQQELAYGESLGEQAQAMAAGLKESLASILNGGVTGGSKHPEPARWNHLNRWGRCWHCWWACGFCGFDDCGRGVNSPSELQLRVRFIRHSGFSS